MLKSYHNDYNKTKNDKGYYYVKNNTDNDTTDANEDNTDNDTTDANEDNTDNNSTNYKNTDTNNTSKK